MSIATLTSKGQVTVPIALRNQLGLKAGDELHFSLNERRQIVVRAKTLTIDDVFGMFKAPKGRNATLEQLKAAGAKHAAEKFRRISKAAK